MTQQELERLRVLSSFMDFIETPAYTDLIRPYIDNQIEKNVNKLLTTPPSSAGDVGAAQGVVNSYRFLKGAFTGFEREYYALRAKSD